MPDDPQSFEKNTRTVSGQPYYLNERELRRTEDQAGSDHFSRVGAKAETREHPALSIKRIAFFYVNYPRCKFRHGEKDMLECFCSQ